MLMGGRRPKNRSLPDTRPGPHYGRQQTERRLVHEYYGSACSLGPFFRRCQPPRKPATAFSFFWLATTSGFCDENPWACRNFLIVVSPTVRPNSLRATARTRA